MYLYDVSRHPALRCDEVFAALAHTEPRNYGGHLARIDTTAHHASLGP